MIESLLKLMLTISLIGLLPLNISDERKADPQPQEVYASDQIKIQAVPHKVCSLSPPSLLLFPFSSVPSHPFPPTFHPLLTTLRIGCPRGGSCNSIFIRGEWWTISQTSSCLFIRAHQTSATSTVLGPRHCQACQCY